MQLSTLCLEFGSFLYDKTRFRFNQFQLDCLLLGKRSVLSPLIFAATLSFMVHVFFDVCCLCFTTGESLVNSLRYVPWGPASSESLVTSGLMCECVNKEKYL